MPAVCCLRVIFPPCAKVFMHWRNLGRSVILLSHRNTRERQRDKGFSVFYFFLFFTGSKEAGDFKGKNCNTTFMCLYISPPSEQQAALSPTWWQMQTHNVHKMLHCVLLIDKFNLQISHCKYKHNKIFSLHLVKTFLLYISQGIKQKTFLNLQFMNLYFIKCIFHILQPQLAM